MRAITPLLWLVLETRCEAVPEIGGISIVPRCAKVQITLETHVHMAMV